MNKVFLVIMESKTLFEAVCEARSFALVVIHHDGSISRHCDMDNLNPVEKIGMIDSIYDLADDAVDLKNERSKID